MYKRIVIKVGTNVITREGRLDEAAIEGIVAQVAELKGKNLEVVVVTSGAVAAGKGILGAGPSDTREERQVFSAVGQASLMSVYAKLFEARGIRSAQVLVTKGDFRDKEHYANMRACFENLLKAGIVPVANENDAVAVHELGFSDNDELASLIASQLNADAVLFLSSVDGVMANGERISEVDSKSLESVARHVTKERSSAGRGGMDTKFKLAKKLMEQGITAYVANGTADGVILDIVGEKSVGTKFVGQEKLSSVKRRLSHADGLAQGTVYVDKGAEKILLSKGSQSLLPVGVIKIEGAFKKGETIDIKNEDGKRLGSGVAQYTAAEAKELLGKKGGKALVHYDYLFIE